MLNSLNQHYKNCITDNKENYKLDLGVKELSTVIVAIEKCNELKKLKDNLKEIDDIKLFHSIMLKRGCLKIIELKRNLTQ